MTPRNDRRESRSACFSCLFQALQRQPGSRNRKLHWVAIAVASLVLFGLGDASVQAQQNWPTDDAYTGPQPGYAQPQYPQPQYGQPQYSQPQYDQPQGYPQQGYSDTNQAYPQQGYSQAAGLNAEQLEQLVAPIALYPDNLLAQVLAASTYPAQVAAADQWLRVQDNAPAEQIAAAVDAQTGWDPSVKALTAFPQVLAEMDRNLQWTTDLGNAYYNQPEDVMQTVQVMRNRAQAAGTLQNTPQEQMSYNQGNIELAPPDPNEEYVPSYDPWQAYGQPVEPYPGFSVLGQVGSFLGNALLQFGPGIATSAFSSTPWGLLSWGIDWLSHSLLFNHDNYFSASTSVADWGFPHGGPRAFGGRGEWARYGDSGRYGGRNGWANGGQNGWGRGGHPEPRPEFGGNRAFGGNREFGGSRGQGFNRYGDTRGGQGWNRGNSWNGNAYTHSDSPRHEQFGRQGYGSGYGQGFMGRQQESYGARNGMAFANPAYREQGPSYRAPESGYRGAFGGRQFGGSAYSKPDHSSGGFHLFGHGHNSNGFGQGHNSNGFGGRASNGGGFGSHGFRGGSFKAPKAPHFSGGGHFGGGHSGGSHFGGGHSGGGHSGGGHGHHR